MTVTLITLIFAMVAIWAIMTPLLSGNTSVVNDGSPSEYSNQRSILAQSLHDADLDHATGKLDDNDYQQIRNDIGKTLQEIKD